MRQNQMRNFLKSKKLWTYGFNLVLFIAALFFAAAYWGVAGFPRAYNLHQMWHTYQWWMISLAVVAAILFVFYILDRTLPFHRFFEWGWMVALIVFLAYVYQGPVIKGEDLVEVTIPSSSEQHKADSISAHKDQTSIDEPDTVVVNTPPAVADSTPLATAVVSPIDSTIAAIAARADTIEARNERKKEAIKVAKEQKKATNKTLADLAKKLEQLEKESKKLADEEAALAKADNVSVDESVSSKKKPCKKKKKAPVYVSHPSKKPCGCDPGYGPAVGGGCVKKSGRTVRFSMARN